MDDYNWAVFKLEDDGEWDQVSIWFATEAEAEHYKFLASSTYTEATLIILSKRI